MKNIEVGVLGATGMVGQQFILQLDRHPWFSLTWLAASERSQGRSYREAAPWRLPSPIPEAIGNQQVEALARAEVGLIACGGHNTRHVVIVSRWAYDHLVQQHFLMLSFLLSQLVWS